MDESSKVSEMHASLPSCHFMIRVTGGSAAGSGVRNARHAITANLRCIRLLAPFRALVPGPIRWNRFSEFIGAQVWRPTCEIVIYIRQSDSRIHGPTAR